jgi:transposase-like protein
MQTAEWKRFIAQFANLSQRQRLAGIALLHGAASPDAAVHCSKAWPGNACTVPPANPRCHRHGHAHGLQRYRCVPCGRTFNALSGTPLARLRHKGRWLAYADCLLASDSVRQAARQLGVHRNTTFRWRHRF